MCAAINGPVELPNWPPNGHEAMCLSEKLNRYWGGAAWGELRPALPYELLLPVLCAIDGSEDPELPAFRGRHND
jgi:hypothetical protein